MDCRLQSQLLCFQARGNIEIFLFCFLCRLMTDTATRRRRLIGALGEHTSPTMHPLPADMATWNRAAGDVWYRHNGCRNLADFLDDCGRIQNATRLERWITKVPEYADRPYGRIWFADPPPPSRSDGGIAQYTEFRVPGDAEHWQVIAPGQGLSAFVSLVTWLALGRTAPTGQYPDIFEAYRHRCMVPQCVTALDLLSLVARTLGPELTGLAVRGAMCHAGMHAPPGDGPLVGVCSGGALLLLLDIATDEGCYRQLFRPVRSDWLVSDATDLYIALHSVADRLQ